jgi:signal transduction histidine kinase
MQPVSANDRSTGRLTPQAAPRARAWPRRAPLLGVSVLVCALCGGVAFWARRSWPAALEHMLSIEPVIAGAGLLIAALCALVLTAAMGRWGFPLSARDPGLNGRVARLSPAFAGVAVAIGVTAVGLVTYVLGSHSVERATRHRLEAVATLKEAHIEAWINDMRDEVRRWSVSPELQRAVQSWWAAGRDPGSSDELQEYLFRLSRTSHFASGSLRDPKTGARLLTIRDEPDSSDARSVAVAIARAARGALALAPLVETVHIEGRPGVTSRMALFAVVPAYDEAARVVLELDIDPEIKFFPFVDRWPGDSDTAEVLLVRADQGTMVVINDEHTQARNRPPRLMSTTTPGAIGTAIAQGGLRGFFRGRDARGHVVFAFALPVPRTPWVLVAKLDEAEAFGELNRVFALASAMAGSLLLVCAWWAREYGRTVNAERRRQQERMQQAETMAELSHRVLSIQDDERRRLAVELHDRTAANLAAIHLNLKHIARDGALARSEESDAVLHETNGLLTDTIVSIRELCAELRPTSLDYAGLVEAIGASLQQFRRRTGIEFEFDCDGISAGHLPEIKAAMFKIVQESLRNCGAHSHASRVRVALAESSGRTTLEIEDNGVGFEIHAVGRNGRSAGHGLLNMRERAVLAGGRLSIDSRPGQGTRVRFEMG